MHKRRLIVNNNQAYKTGSQELRNSCVDIYNGECLNWDNVFCTAGWETGLCPGANNIKVGLIFHI